MGADEMRYCYFSINLLGDPETPFLFPGAVPAAVAEPPAPAADPGAAVKRSDSSPEIPTILSGEMRFEFGEPMEFKFGEGMGMPGIKPL